MNARASLMLPALLILSACALPDYRERVQAERARLPGLSRVGWSGSMFPVLAGGDLIRCRGVPFADIKPGDLVRFWPAWSDMPIAHRAKYWDGPGRLITQGDNCLYQDAPITEEIYVGVWQPVPGSARPRPANVPRSFVGLRVSLPDIQ